MSWVDSSVANFCRRVNKGGVQRKPTWRHFDLLAATGADGEGGLISGAESRRNDSAVRLEGSRRRPAEHAHWSRLVSD